MRLRRHRLWTAVVAIIASLGVARGESPRVAITGLDDRLRNNVVAFVAIDRYDCEAPDWQLTRYEPRIVSAATEAPMS